MNTSILDPHSPLHTDWIDFSIENKCVTFKVKDQVIHDGTTFLEKTTEVVEKLKRTHNGRLLVGFSGGMDSEFTVRSLLSGNVDFETITIDFGCNDYELEHQEMLCKELNIKPNIIKLSPKEFTLLIKEKYRSIINSYYLGTYLFLYLSDMADISNQTFLGSDMVPITRSSMRAKLLNRIDSMYAYWETDTVFRRLKKHHIDGFLGLDQILSYNYFNEIKEGADLAAIKSPVYNIRNRTKQDYFLNSNWFKGHLSVMKKYETIGCPLYKEKINEHFKVITR